MPRLRVSRAVPVARDIHRIELCHPDGAPLAPFTAGAHVEVTSPGGLARKYSLCNDPAQTRQYVIAVKRDVGGRGGSVDLVDHAHEGALLEVGLPRNAFELEEKAASHLLLAGGIGVTPILAMVWRLEAIGAPYRLVYCTRGPEDTAFASELASPARTGKVTIHHDGGDPARMFDLWTLLEKPTRAHVYACGPRPMLEAVRDMTGHWSPSAIHMESFLDAASARKPEDHAFSVVLAQSQSRVEVPPGISILEAMRAAGHDAPSSCESGTCGTCRTRLLEGKADHRDLVLTDDERESHLMICISRALTPEITIDR